MVGFKQFRETWEDKTMRYLKAGASLFVLTMLVAIAVPKARAGEMNWRTYLTFSQPVEVPGLVLAAGRYEFRLIDAAYTSHQVVGIYDSRGNLLKMILAVPDYRTQTTAKTVVTLEKTGPTTPEALKAWFYPDSYFGVEFVYPKTTENKKG